MPIAPPPFLDEGCQLGDNFPLATDSYGLLLFGTTLEVNERGDTADTEVGGNARGIVHIDFGNSKFADVFGSNFLNNWTSTGKEVP